jgi:O-antigen ligase
MKSQFYSYSLLGVRGRARAAIHQFLGESKWHLLYLSILCIMGVVGFVVSPYHSKTRLALFFMGLATYGMTVALVDSPDKLWKAVGLLSIVGLATTLIGTVVIDWTTNKLPAISAITDHIPRAPSSFLALIDARSGIHPNEVAGVLTLYIPPLLGFLLFRERAALFDRRARVFSLLTGVVLGVMAIYVALSLSRASVLALGVAVILLLWVRERTWGGAALGAIGVGVIGAYFILPSGTLNVLFSNALATFTGSGETRTEIWRQAVQAIGNAPLTGIGLYNFGAIFRYNIYLPPDWPFPITHAHNIFLQASLDLGLPGAIAYALLLADVTWHAFSTGRRLEGPAAGLAYGLGAAVLAFGIYGLFDAIQLTSRVAWLTWFIVGMAGAAARIGDQLTKHDSAVS